MHYPLLDMKISLLEQILEQPFKTNFVFLQGADATIDRNDFPRFRAHLEMAAALLQPLRKN